MFEFRVNISNIADLKSAIEILRENQDVFHPARTIGAPVEKTGKVTGPLESEYLKLTGKAHMRGEGERDREEVAAERIRQWREKNGAKASEPTAEFEADAERFDPGEFDPESISADKY